MTADRKQSNAGGWCAPTHVICACGATDWPHTCTLPTLPGLVDLEEMVVRRVGVDREVSEPEVPQT